MLCLFLPPEDTMEVVKGYRLESLSRLKCISGTEIFFGLIYLLLFVIGIILVITQSNSSSHFTWSWSLILNVAFYLLLFITGCFGVHLVNRWRNGSGSASSFSILAGMNVVLCIIYSVFLVLVIVAGILIAVTSHYINTGWEYLATSVGLDKAIFTDPKAHTLQEGVKTATWAITVMVVVTLIVTGLFLLMFAVLTGMAAKISRRNAAILSIPVTSGYNDSLLASMGGTYAKGAPTYGEYNAATPTYGEYHAVKQHI